MEYGFGMFWPMIAVITIATLSFLAFVAWIASREKERERYHRNETVRKIGESSNPEAGFEYLREADRLAQRRHRNGVRLAGLVAIAAGIGLMGFLRAIAPSGGAYLISLVPLLVGIVLLGFGQLVLSTD